MSGGLRRAALGTPDGLLATCFGVGLAPRAPGSVGSLAALLPAWALLSAPVAAQLVVALAALGLGILACGRFERRIGSHDHGAVVWDEVVGMWITLLGAPAEPRVLLYAFLLFRFFDILKPPPIGWVDRRVGGGLGVMADDVLAAVMALLVLQALLALGA